jgi:hypothetical protein
VLFGVAHTGEIAAGVAGGLLLFLAVVLLVAYRNWRYEQELDSLLWKVDYRDIRINEDQQVQGGASLSTKINRVSQQNSTTSCTLVQGYGPPSSGWKSEPCNWANRQGICGFAYSSTLKMEAVYSCETLANFFYQISRRHPTG